MKTRRKQTTYYTREGCKVTHVKTVRLDHTRIDENVILESAPLELQKDEPIGTVIYYVNSLRSS
jgi:hypothetical protein